MFGENGASNQFRMLSKQNLIDAANFFWQVIF